MEELKKCLNILDIERNIFMTIVMMISEPSFSDSQVSAESTGVGSSLLMLSFNVIHEITLLLRVVVA